MHADDDTAPPPRCATPAVPLSGVAAVVVSVLIIICSGTMLLVTVPSSVDAGMAFGPRYSAAAAAIGAERARDVLAVLVQPYRALAHGTASGLLPIFTTSWNLPRRYRYMEQYLFAMRTSLVALGDQLKDISAGFTDRTYVNCISSNSGGPWHRCFMSDRRNGTGWRYDWDWVGPNLTRAVSYKSGFNPKSQAWYKDAPKDNRSSAHFSDVYVVSGYNSAVVDVTSPLFGPPPTSRFLGITSITLDLRRMSRFLTGIPGMTAGTQVVLLDNYGYLVGASNSAEELWNRTDYNASTYNATEHVLTPNCSRFNANSGTVKRVFCRYDGSDYPGSPALNALWARYNDRIWRNISDAGEFGNESARVMVNTSWSARLRLVGDGADEGRRHFVSATPVTLPGTENLFWMLIVLVPERDVVGAILDGRDVAVNSGAGVAAGACVLCALALVLLLRPLVEVGRRMGDAATLQDEHLEHSGGPRSVLREVRAVQDAMYRLCGQLRKAKTFLPATMLALLVVSEEGGSTAGPPEDDDEEGSVAMTPRGFSDSWTTDRSGQRPGGRAAFDAVSRGSSRRASAASGRTGAARGAEGQRLTADRGSQRSSQRSGRSGTSSHSRVVGEIAGLSLGQRVVSVLAANVRDFHKDVRAGVGSGIIAGASSAYAAFVAAAVQAAEAHCGVLDSFHGDRLFLAFNAVKPASSHAALALRAALQLSRTPASPHGGGPKGSQGLGILRSRLSAGVACGTCLVGNMGSAAQRRPAVVGIAYTQAVALERLCRLYAAGAVDVLVAGTAAQDADATIELAHLDLVTLPGGGHAHPDAPTTGVPLRVSWALAVRAQRVDPWLFDGDAPMPLSLPPLRSGAGPRPSLTGVAGGPVGAANRAFMLALDGRHSDAAAALAVAISVTAGTHPVSPAVTPRARPTIFTVHSDDASTDNACGRHSLSASITSCGACPATARPDADRRAMSSSLLAIPPNCFHATEAGPHSRRVATAVGTVQAVLQQWERGGVRARPMHDFFTRCVAGLTDAEVEHFRGAADPAPAAE